MTYTPDQLRAMPLRELIRYYWKTDWERHSLIHVVEVESILRQRIEGIEKP